MTPFRSRALSMFGLLFLVAASPAGAAKPAAAPPAAVLKAFQLAYPKATIQRTLHERRDGNPVVEIESVDQGMRRDLLYTPEGRMIECEETIPVTGLPAPVRAALERETRGAKLGRIERIDREGVVTYAINVRLKGKAQELVFDPKGKRVEP